MENKYRLPKSVIPSYYSITIEPDLDNEKFNGSEIISVTIKEKTNSIKLNSIGLVINKAEIIDIGLESKNITEDKEHETISINFDQDLEPGDYNLELIFLGDLDNSLRGFYLSRYKDEHGIDHKIGTTQFESTDARRAFPCFDEPEFKSIFSITLKVPKGLFTVSNTGIKNTTNTDSHDIYEFKDSIKMSTYLVAFVIGPFEATDEVNVNGVPLRIVHAIGKSHLTDFAIETGKFALNYFTEYFGRPYPGDKLDMVAIPDFASGAMENLGCITYREALLLVDKEKATQAELTRIADVVMHEIAHMWFGDLVTMKWWNGIWLNEAFATFMATKAVDKFNPNWERWVEFGIEKSAAFDVDSLETTRAIEFDVISPDDASAMFDLLTYEKGGAVLRMLEQHVGEDLFRNGIRNYLDKHQYSNTETEDLWESIELFSSIPVRETMNSWILQPGFPRVYFETDKAGILKISQSTFRYDNSNDETLWKIPLEIKYELNGKVDSKKLLLEKNSDQIELGNGVNVISGNSNGNGFYRSQYEVSRDFSSDKNFLNKSEKFSLVDDLWASTVSCITPIDKYINDVLSFNNDTDTELQSLIISSLTSLKRHTDKSLTPIYVSILEKYVSSLLSKIGEKPRDNESIKMKELRSIAFKCLAITCENNDFLSKLKEIYNDSNNKSNLDPNLVAASVATVAYYGNANTYAEFFSKYEKGETPQEKMRFLYSLAEFRDPDLLSRTLNASVSNEIKNQDAPYLIAYTLRNYRHTAYTWNFIQDNWAKIIIKFPDNSIPRIFGGIKLISDKTLADKIETFFNNNRVPQGQKTINQNIEKMYLNIKFIDHQGKILNNFLKTEATSES